MSISNSSFSVDILRNFTDLTELRRRKARIPLKTKLLFLNEKKKDRKKRSKTKSTMSLLKIKLSFVSKVEDIHTVFTTMGVDYTEMEREMS